MRSSVVKEESPGLLLFDELRVIEQRRQARQKAEQIAREKAEAEARLRDETMQEAQRRRSHAEEEAFRLSEIARMARQSEERMREAERLRELQTAAEHELRRVTAEAGAATRRARRIAFALAAGAAVATVAGAVATINWRQREDGRRTATLASMYEGREALLRSQMMQMQSQVAETSRLLHTMQTRLHASPGQPAIGTTGKAGEGESHPPARGQGHASETNPADPRPLQVALPRIVNPDPMHGIPDGKSPL